VLSPPTGAITTVAVAPDGHSALTGGPDATMVWDLPDRGQPTPVAALPIGGGPVAATYRGDSQVLATGVGNLAQTWSVKELLVYRPAQVQPAATLNASMSVAEPIRSAATNTVGSYVIVSGSTSAATVWSTRVAGVERPRLDQVATLDAPADHISAVGDLAKTTVVTTNGHAPAAAWQLASPGVIQRVGTLTESADYAAVTPDGNDAVVVSGTAATLYDLAINPGPIATLSYPLPTTTLAFAPQGTALIAGHPDGSITVHTIELPQQHAGRRHLDSRVPSPIDAVGLSADATTALGVHQDGTISAWHLAAGGKDPAITNTSAAAGPGPHQAWLSPNGDFAIVTSRDRAVLWSYTDRTQLTPLATLIAAHAAIPVLISADGRTAVQINPDNALTLWDLQPVKGVVDNPTARACQLADLGYQRWREIEPNPAFDTPCLPAPLPQLDNPKPSPTPQR